MNQSHFSIFDWKDKFLMRFRKGKTIICNFELLNGFHTTTILQIDTDKVWFKGKPYLIDDALKYFHLGMKSYCLDYHEGFSIPIQRKLPVDIISQTISSLNIGNISYATNPTTLKTFQINEVIKSAIQSASITDFFRSIRLMTFIGAIASILVLLLVAHGQGLFASLGIGG